VLHVLLLTDPVSFEEVVKGQTDASARRGASTLEGLPNEKRLAFMRKGVLQHHGHDDAGLRRCMRWITMLS